MSLRRDIQKWPDLQDPDYPHHPDDLQAKQTVTDWKDFKRKEGAL